jgi:hypothetical protein
LQFKAFILFLCTLMYMVEYAATPRIMEVACAGGMVAAQGAHSCCDGMAQGEKCGRGMQAGECNGAAGGKKCDQAMRAGKKGQGPSKGCNPAADCCLNCPLCYVMVLPASPATDGITTVQQEYAVWTSSYVYLYHSSCWKPPNAA